MSGKIKAWAVEFVTNQNNVTTRFIRTTKELASQDCDEFNKTDPFKDNGKWSYRPIFE